MGEQSQDVLARAYARLSSLRKNVSQMSVNQILETYVNEYHAILDKLKGIGIEISEFLIPDSLVKPKITSSSWEGGISHHNYSEEKYVDKPFLLTKIDSILGYFEIIISEKPKKMGFTKSDE